MIVNKTIDLTLNPKSKQYGPARRPVYLCLLWKEQRPAEMVERAVVKAVYPTFQTCEVKVIYATKPAFPGSLKNQIPTHKNQMCFLSKRANMAIGMWER